MTTTSVNAIIDEIKNAASEEYAAFIRRSIQSENGYGKGDVVIGCRVPILRKIAKKYCSEISAEDLLKLLQSKYHEARALALMIMTAKFQNEDLRKNVVQLYLDNISFINNWDLVDMSSHHIIGSYFKSDDPIFERLSNSNNLWENRIAIVSTWAFIRRANFDPTLRLCEKFMKHEHHLIHKACGWMLREVGKRDKNVLINFLRKHSANMPKIMLSYAKERVRNVQKNF